MTDNHLLLYRLAELMLQHEQHVLPVDLLFDDEQIGDFVKSIQIDSPYQQMLLEGVLTESVRDEKLYVSFTVEGYFHYVLGEVIYLKTYNEKKSSSYLLNLILNSELKGISRALNIALVKFVHSGNSEHLIWLIDNSDEAFLNIYVEPFYQLLLNNSNEIAFKYLLANQNFKGYSILYQVFKYLEHNVKYTIIEKISKLLIEKFDKSILSVEYWRVILFSVNFLDRNDILTDEILNLIVSKTIDLGSNKIRYDISLYLLKLGYYKYSILVLKKIKNHNKESFKIIAICYQKSNKYKLALRYYMKYSQHLLEKKNDVLLAEFKYNLSTLYWDLKDYDQSLSLNFEALQIERKILGTYNESYLISLFSYALNLRLNRKYDNASEIIETCISILHKTVSKSSKLYLEVYLIKGANSSDLNNTEASIESYESAIEYYTNDEPISRNPSYFLQEQYFNLGEKFMQNGNFFEAEYYFLKCLHKYQAFSIENKFVPPYYELAECYKEMSNYRLALDYYDLSIRKNINTTSYFYYNPKFWVGIVYLELAKIASQDSFENDEYLKYFKLSKKHLSKWLSKIDDENWNKYISSLLDYINTFLSIT